MKRIKYTVLLLLMAASICRAADYYVATTGNDSNLGTSQQPWLTIQHAVSVAVAGDVVNVEAGTYAISSFLNLSKSGTSGSYITFQCATQWACKLQLAGPLSGALEGNESGNLHQRIVRCVSEF